MRNPDQLFLPFGVALVTIVIIRVLQGNSIDVPTTLASWLALWAISRSVLDSRNLKVLYGDFADYISAARRLYERDDSQFIYVSHRTWITSSALLRALERSPAKAIIFSGQLRSIDDCNVIGALCRLSHASATRKNIKFFHTDQSLPRMIVTNNCILQAHPGPEHDWKVSGYYVGRAADPGADIVQFFKEGFEGRLARMEDLDGRILGLIVTKMGGKSFDRSSVTMKLQYSALHDYTALRREHGHFLSEVTIENLDKLISEFFERLQASSKVTIDTSNHENPKITVV